MSTAAGGPTCRAFARSGGSTTRETLTPGRLGDWRLARVPGHVLVRHVNVFFFRLVGAPD